MLAIYPDDTNIICPLIGGGQFHNPVRVTTKSLNCEKQAVCDINDFFSKEIGCMLQYSETDPNQVAFLWIHPEGQDCSKEFQVPCIGACCFYRQESGYELQWVWLHPYWRGRGLLSEAWPKFISEFGEFDVEPPITKAMAAFLKKHGFKMTEKLKHTQSMFLRYDSFDSRWAPLESCS